MLRLAPVPVVPGGVPRQQTLRQGALGESGWSDRDMLASVLLHRGLAQPCDLYKNQRRARGCCDRGPVHQPGLNNTEAAKCISLGDGPPSFLLDRNPLSWSCG